MRGAQNGKLAGGLAAVVILGLAAGVWPNVRSARSLDSDIEDLSSRVERSDDGHAALERLRASLAERETEARQTLRHIPTDGDVGGLIRAMSDKLGALGLGRPEIKTGRPVEHDEAKALPMTIEMRGGFLQLLSAVGWVESIDRLVRVRKIRFETPVGTGRSPLFGEPLKGEIVLDVYYDPKLVSPFDAPVANATEPAP